jgi:Protein kinase domain/WD40-like Beta Propeller Repeat
MAADVWIGRELAGYRIERVLGRGGMGVVYLAEDTRLGRNVALKLLSPDLAEDARFRERFVRESRLAASIDHPNIIPIYAAGEADGTLYLAMRYIEGTDLRALVGEHGALDPARAAAIVRQLAGALDAAHARGLVHRDVKPANVLLPAGPGDEHAYLTDFGLTKQASSITGLTVTGQLVGTVDYLAPEVIEGRPADGRSDQYALACLLYECLTGAPPFRRETEAATLWAHMNADRAELPLEEESARAAVERGLAKAPDDRFGTCTDMARAVVGARPEYAPPSRRGWIFASAIGALALVAAVAAGLLATGGGSGPKAAPAVAPGSVAMIDAASGRLVGSVHIGGVPGAAAAAGDAVYIADPTRTYLTRIDAAGRRVAGRTSTLGATATGLAAASDGSLWVAAGYAEALLHVDSGGTHVAWTAPAGACCPGPSIVVAGPRIVWLSDGGGLRMIDAASGHLTKTMPPAGTSGISEDVYGDAWVSDGLSTVRDFSASAPGKHVDYGGLAGGGAGLGAAGASVYALGNVWVTTPEAGSVYVIGTDIGPIAIPGRPSAIAFGAGRVWVANTTDVFEIDPLNGVVRRRIHVGGRIGGLAVSGGTVWVTVRPQSAGAAAAATQLAYADGGKVYVANGDGSHKRVVAANPSTAYATVSWSPDGSQIALATDLEKSQAGTRSPLWAVSAAGGPVSALTSFDLVSDPAWSPDGRRIAFAHDNDIWVADADGRRAHDVARVSLATEVFFAPTWSPDGTRIAFTGGVPGRFQKMYVVNADGGRFRSIRFIDTEADSGRWSPDGLRLAFGGFVGGYGTYVGPVGGGSTYKVFGFPQGRYVAPAWSPDGTLLAIGAQVGVTPGGRTNLYVAYADGTGLTRITTDFLLTGVAWRPVRQTLTTG